MHITQQDRIAALEAACRAEQDGIERSERAGNCAAEAINRNRLAAAQERLSMAQSLLQSPQAKCGAGEAVKPVNPDHLWPEVCAYDQRGKEVLSLSFEHWPDAEAFYTNTKGEMVKNDHYDLILFSHSGGTRISQRSTR